MWGSTNATEQGSPCWSSPYSQEPHHQLWFLPHKSLLLSPNSSRGHSARARSPPQAENWECEMVSRQPVGAGKQMWTCVSPWRGRNCWEGSVSPSQHQQITAGECTLFTKRRMKQCAGNRHYSFPILLSWVSGCCQHCCLSVCHRRASLAVDSTLETAVRAGLHASLPYQLQKWLPRTS